MSLISLLEELKYRTPITILPELRAKMLADIKQRYSTDLEPEIWRLYFGDDPQCEFPTRCFEIIKDVIEKNMSVPDKDRDRIAEEFFGESDSYFYEMSSEFKSQIDFIDKLIKESRSEIERYFPSCEKVFEETASQLLVDLAFQNRVYEFTKSAKSDLADFKRMINICGQIVEDVFCKKGIFTEPKKIGEIYRDLKVYTEAGGIGREDFLRRVTYGKKLIDKYFLDKLKRVAKLRNDYSHGTGLPANPESDFRVCLSALLEPKFGILYVLYESLKE